MCFISVYFCFLLRHILSLDVRKDLQEALQIYSSLQGKLHQVEFSRNLYVCNQLNLKN